MNTMRYLMQVSEVLTRPGTDIDRFFDRFSYRHTALFIATKLNRIELMRLLLDAGADPNLICTSSASLLPAM